MRRLRRLILLLLLCAFTWWLVGEALRFYQGYQQAQYRSEWIEQGVGSVGFVLTEKQWLEFDIPDQQSVIRILSNASLIHEEWELEDQEYPYVIEYQLLDDDGQLLSEVLYHHRSHVSQPKEDELLGKVPRQFYTEGELLPADGRLMMINMHGLQNPKRLRMRLHSGDPRLQDVVVRCYIRESVAEHKLAYQWARMSEKKREFLARGSIYEHALLSEVEKRNLLTNMWQPMGPIGVRGRDYHDRALYTLRDYEELPELRGDDIQPAGLWIDRWVNGIVPVPYGGGEVRLEFSPLDPEQVMDGRVEIYWSGPGVNNRKQFEQLITQSEGHFQQVLENGILDIRSDIPLLVRAFLLEGDTPLEITPETSYLRGYFTSSEQWVEFPIDHYEQQIMPARFDFRRSVLDPLFPDSSEQDILYQILDRSGKVIRSGKLDYSFQFSHYDRSLDKESGRYLSLPQRYYFNFDKRAHKVRFRSTSPLLVSGYSRPYELPLLIRVPKDYFGQVEDEQPTWFVLLPANRAELELAKKNVLLRLQSAPPEDDPRLLQGEYQWQEYRPRGDWLARDLLLPREPGLPLRSESLAAVYNAMPANQEHRITLQSEAWLKQIRPTLFYQRESATPIMLRVLLDGIEWYRAEIAQQRGELRLPTVVPGEYRLQIVAEEGAEFYLNYTRGAAPLIKRLSNRFDASHLSFSYPKVSDGAEVLSARWHVPIEQVEPSRLEVSITLEQRLLNRPLLGWTVHKRIYELSPNRQQDTALWGTQHQWLDGGERFFIPMDEDLPAGDYQITLRRSSGSAGYLSLSQLTPGAVESYRLFREEGRYD